MPVVHQAAGPQQRHASAQALNGGLAARLSVPTLPGNISKQIFKSKSTGRPLIIKLLLINSNIPHATSQLAKGQQVQPIHCFMVVSTRRQTIPKVCLKSVGGCYSLAPSAPVRTPTGQTNLFQW